MALNQNAFGELVRAYRKQRGWTQEELAERWGYTRGYVSLIESGKKKLDSLAQVVRLADILDIPQEKLEAIGRGIPTRQRQASVRFEEDEHILHMLLAPGRDMVRLAWIAWIGDQHPVIEENLRDLVFNLDQALTIYRGEFRKPAQQLLAYAHQMLGKIAFDRLDFAAASGHFSEMITLGQELDDPDIITVGMTQQGSIFRKRGRFEQAFRCFEAVEHQARIASHNIQGVRYLMMARGYYDFGDEQGFLRAINPALEIAAQIQDSITSLANDFSLDDVLQEQASGYTELWKPEKALEIYKETDRLRPFRPLRDQGAYIINKAQAYLHLGDFDEGIKFALRGIQLASDYRSKRHIFWLDKTYRQLRELPMGKDRQLALLAEALRKARQDIESW
jgi:transcriptional regulator with XRE-family HTH domain